MAGRESGFVRWIKFQLDKPAARRMQEEAAEALEKSGKESAEKFADEMKKGGPRAARALTRSLEAEYKARMASLRIQMADGLISEKDYKAKGRDAAAAFNAGLSAGIKDLRGRADNPLSAQQTINLAGRFKNPGADASAGGGGGMLAGLAGKAAGPLAALFAADRIKDTAKELFTLGSAAEETASKFSTTFGPASKDMQAFLDKWGTLAGLNDTTERDFAATAGSIAQGMGLTRGESAKLSEQILRLAGDLTSFDNKPIEQSFGAVIGGITGEREALKQFGIIIKQEDVETRALAQTHKKFKDELTEGELAVASLSLMYEKAGVKIGDLERTQDSTANRTRQLTAEYENLKIEVAGELMPVFSDMVGWVGENKEGLKDLARGGITVVMYAVQLLYGSLNALGNTIVGIVLGSVSGLTLGLAYLARGFAVASEAEASFKGMFNSEWAAGARRDAAVLREKADALERYSKAASDAAKESFRAIDDPTLGRRERPASGSSTGGAAATPPRTPTGNDPNPAAARRAAAAARKAEQEAKRQEKEEDKAFADRARLVTEQLNRSIDQGQIPAIKFRTEILAPPSPAAAALAAQTAAQRASELIQTTHVNGLKREADQLAGIARWRSLTREEIQRAAELEKEIAAKLADQTLSLEEQADLTGNRNDLRGLLAETSIAAYGLEGAMQSLQSVTEGFFTALFTGFDKGRDGFHSLADAAIGVGAGIVGGLSQGMAEYHAAQGAGKLAEGTWPPNPAALAAAGLHFGAAGLFRALGGILGGAGRRSAAASNTAAWKPDERSYDFQQSDRAGSLAAARMEGATLTVQIATDPFDPTRPPVINTVGRAMKTYVELNGSGWAA